MRSAQSMDLWRDDFISLHMRLSKVLYEHWDPTDATAFAEEEWWRRGRGEATIDKAAFCELLFDTADAWVIGIAPTARATFLFDLFGRVANDAPPTERRWRQLREIDFGGYRAGQFSAWGQLPAGLDAPKRAGAISRPASARSVLPPTTLHVPPPLRDASAPPRIAADAVTDARLGAAAWRRVTLHSSCSPTRTGTVARGRPDELRVNTQTQRTWTKFSQPNSWR